KRPAQAVATGDADDGEDGAHRHVFGERGGKPEQRKHHNLCHYRNAVSDSDIGERFHQRHGARLLHAAASLVVSPASSTRSAAIASKLRPSPSSVACLPVYSCQRLTTTSQKASDSSRP